MYKVQYKSRSAFQSWVNYGSYGNEAAALAVASRLRSRYLLVRVINRHRAVVWSN